MIIKTMDNQELIEEYIQSIANRSKATKNSYSTLLRLFARYCNENYSVGLLEVEKKHVANFVSQYDYKQTKDTYKRTISIFYNFLIESDILSKNPAKIGKIVGGKRKKANFMSRTDFEELLRQCDKITETAIAYLFYYTGARAKEVRHIELQDVDIKREMIFLGVSKVDVREVPIHPDLMDFLKLYLEKRYEEETEKTWLFLSNRDNQYDERTIIHFMERIQNHKIDKNKSKIAKKRVLKKGQVFFTCHDYRRSFITRLYRATGDIVLCQTLAGHKKIETTRKYIIADKILQNNVFKKSNI